MKKIQVLARFSATALSAVLLLLGCQKNENPTATLTAHEEEQLSVASAESETESQAAFDDVLANVLGAGDAGIGDVGIFGRVPSASRVAKTDTVPYCVTLSVSPLRPGEFPKTITMDFGSGCRSHGHLRSGKITSVYTGRLSENGKSATTTFENFRFDSIAIEGTHKITNTTAQGSNERQFTVQITDAKLTALNGNYTEWSATRVHTQIEGNATLSPADDIFRLIGNSTGKTKSGSRLFSWTALIQEPLIRPLSCRWTTKGIIATTRAGAAANSPWTGLLNFGNGTCDNAAALTINGNNRQIVLR